MKLTNHPKMQMPSISTQNIQSKSMNINVTRNFAYKKKEKQSSITSSGQRLSPEVKNRKVLTNPSSGRYAKIVIETKRSNTEQLRKKSPPRRVRTSRQGVSISYANQLVTNFCNSISESKLQQQRRQDQNSGKIICRSITKKQGQSKQILQEQNRSLMHLFQMKKSMEYEKGFMLSQNIIKYKSPVKKSKHQTMIKPNQGSLCKIKPKTIQNYIEFIHGQSICQKYTVGFDFNYLRQLRRGEVEQIIDFQYYKILESIMLCTEDIYTKCEKEDQMNDKDSLCNLFREYSLLFFRLFQKNIMQIVISQTAITSFFVLTRMYFILQHELALNKLIIQTPFTQKMKQSLLLMIEITKILYVGRKQIFEEKNYVAQTLKLLKISSNIDKKMSIFIPTFKRLCQQIQNISRIKEIIEYFTPFQKNFNFQGLDLQYLSQLEIIIGWNYFQIPPVPYLPMISSSSKYTLIIGIHKVLVSYNSLTEVIMYRPYIHTFLTKMKQSFEIVAFTNEGKEISDQLIDCIEGNDSYFSFRLYKDHLSFKDGFMSKDLTKLGRQTSKVLLIDVDNGQQIKQKGVLLLKQFIDDKSDKQLMNVLHHIEWALKSSPLDLPQQMSQYRNSLEHIQQDFEQNYSTIK